MGSWRRPMKFKIEAIVDHKTGKVLLSSNVKGLSYGEVESCLIQLRDHLTSQIDNGSKECPYSPEMRQAGKQAHIGLRTLTWNGAYYEGPCGWKVKRSIEDWNLWRLLDPNGYPYASSPYRTILETEQGLLLKGDSCV